MPALRAFAADPDAAHCAWAYFGAFDDWVNTFAMHNLVRGLRADVPVAVGFHLRGDAVEGPAHGRTLYSRAAVDALAARVLTPACPDDAADATDAVGLARCAWAAGVVPVHTARFDVWNMGPSTDWAFQVPNYLLGLAMTIDQREERNQVILAAYWVGTYGQFLNLTTWHSPADIDTLVRSWTGWGCVRARTREASIGPALTAPHPTSPGIRIRGRGASASCPTYRATRRRAIATSPSPRACASSVHARVARTRAVNLSFLFPGATSINYRF